MFLYRVVHIHLVKNSMSGFPTYFTFVTFAPQGAIMAKYTSTNGFNWIGWILVAYSSSFYIRYIVYFVVFFVRLTLIPFFFQYVSGLVICSIMNKHSIQAKTSVSCLEVVFADSIRVIKTTCYLVVCLWFWSFYGRVLFCCIFWVGSSALVNFRVYGISWLCFFCAASQVL